MTAAVGWLAAFSLLALVVLLGPMALKWSRAGEMARRTEQVVRQVLRYIFLDTDASADVVVQKLRQTHFSISLRSVRRIIADYGLQKKTLRTQPGQKRPRPQTARSKHPKPRAHGRQRPDQRRARGSSTAGR